MCTAAFYYSVKQPNWIPLSLYLKGLAVQVMLHPSRHLSDALLLHYNPPYTAFADDKDMLNVCSPANRPTFITVMQQKALQLFRYAK